MINLDGTPEQKPPGRQCHPGRLDGCRARLGRRRAALPLYRHLGGDDAVRLPVPMMNVINGGAHTNWTTVPMQEFMIVPFGAATFQRGAALGRRDLPGLKGLLKARELYPRWSATRAASRPTSPRWKTCSQMLTEAIEKAGYRPGEDMGIALDPAASEFYQRWQVPPGRYLQLTAAELVDLYAGWRAKYPLVSIEDGVAEDDWDGWQVITQRLGGSTQLVGDDLFVTNVERIQRGIDADVSNSVLIKLNQIGTVTETINAIRLAHPVDWTAVVSHRSGETVDSFISDFVVGLGTGQIKTGATARGERVEKYNQLLRIEEELGDRAEYPGRAAFRH